MDKGLKLLYKYILAEGWRIASYMISKSTYVLIILERGPYEKKLFVRLNEGMKNV